ncbi:Mannose or cellobiose epimerase, N-acyl-D-glucosamine 2-epimerase family [Devosia sp. YR412]|uniref:AGE family epimerase/isomerase n=1 Tax=Devosia sp. YR412 TaxID=1881030 RepID=UPI0008B19F9C|nr:AGE family epimerase/isomerase [Devosia sp. YR412]SEP75108.1 Mannose or cellobiose epimerase, N-acyl-D-glucosamine 2-epimerase family [Devosia sp. YR412]
MTELPLNLAKTNSSPWPNRLFHRQYLMRQANNLYDFFEAASINPKGGFFELDDEGLPVDAENATRQIHVTTRMVHCAVIGSLLGRPGSDEIVDHGMRFIWEQHRDAEHGGYAWGVDDDGISNGSKQAYGHAFVLLAASSAKLVGHPLAEQMLADVTKVINERFWDDKTGTVKDEYSQDWSELLPYRGQNANMHMTEALMAAFEATGNKDYLVKAERIAEKIILKTAVPLGHRVAEHFDENWVLDKGYEGNEMFRPSGATPGHWLEWSRLLYQLWILGDKRANWMTGAARELFRQSIELGWDKLHGGFFYTLDWDNQPIMREKLWWPLAEAIGASAYISAFDNEDYFQIWYRKLWDHAENHVIDHARGGWLSELKEDLTPTSRLFVGKPDIYHALQACLIPLYPTTGSLTKGIIEADHTVKKII